MNAPEVLKPSLTPCSPALAPVLHNFLLVASLCDVFHASRNLTFLSIRARNSFINGRIIVLADKLSKQFWKRIHQGLPSCSGRGPRRSRRSRSRQARLFSALTSLDSCISPACIPAPLFSESLAKPLPASLVEEGGSLLHYSFEFSPTAVVLPCSPSPLPPFTQVSV